MSETSMPDDPDPEEAIPIDPRITPVLFREWLVENIDDWALRLRDWT